MPHPKRSSAFTLLEVLVALAIIAVALGAAANLSGSMVDTSYYLKQRTLARWIAHNRLNLLLAQNSFPAIGSNSGEETMGGQQFYWQEDVSNTPNQYFRRVELRIYSDDDRDFALSNLSGYIHVTQN